MKIAIVYHTICPYVAGGIEKRNWEIGKRLARRGHQVTLFGMKHWEGEDIIVKEDVRLWGYCPDQELYANGRRSIKQAIYFAGKVLPPLLKEKYDVIEVPNFPYFPCFSAKLASSLKRCALVVTWHEVWSGYWYKYLGPVGVFGQIVERMTSHLTNNVITNSEMTKRDLAKIAGVKRVTVIPNGIDLPSIERVIPFAERSDILFAGRLIKEKNVDLLIRSIGVIKRSRPSIHCQIVGDGPEREKLERLVEDLDLGSNVRFTGFLENYEEVLARMKSSKVFVLPSVREGFGIVALEAAACGLPVVTVRHPQNAACDLVIDGETGYIAELFEQDIADKLIMAIENSELMSGKCRELAQPFDWDEVASKTEHYFLKVIGSLEAMDPLSSEE